MITGEEKQKIILVLGKFYSEKVISYLNEKEIKNKFNLPYTDNSVRVVMNGGRGKVVENAIIDLYEIEREKIEEVKRKRKEIFKK